jgi:hypothetical protein
MAILQVTGTVVDGDGLSTPFTGTINTSTPPVISSVTIVPQSAPVGTTRMITIVAVGTPPLTYNLSVSGVAQPPNSTGIFTVVV